MHGCSLAGLASLLHGTTTANRQSKRAHRENKDFRQVVESERADVARVVAGLVTAAESDVGSLVHVEAGSCREVWLHLHQNEVASSRKRAATASSMRSESQHAFKA